MRLALKLIFYTMIAFVLLVVISALIDSTSLGFPFWFYKDACSISVNPETGETFGVTSATDWLNLGLDIVVAFIIAYAFLFLLNRKKFKIIAQKI
ncbi:hypothetical protein GJU39_10670 [Pedobacter petrophilus]|uniref:Uncharacterized protein n=2 Tax=Pedobacter petrophilus TaxID=1908241 RepID=A0A7K0FYG0_9SPHI|nr:hypothetical protein [Pedobacter petrophilus]MRX76555.1 hypothetical protein [Pedobacter petrophilus]